MKKLIAFSFVVISLSNAANAQTERVVEDKPKQERHNGRQEKMEMAKELGLTKEQMVQMKQNHQDMKAKQEALKANENITVKEMKERKAALRAEQEASMAKILTPAQKIKFEQMKKERKEKGKERREKNNDLMPAPQK